MLNFPNTRFLSLIIPGLLTLACGKSLFESVEKGDDAVDATLKMEQGDPGGAISILTSALSNNPTDYQLVSLLASAQAQLAGIDIVSVALNMATADNTDQDTNEVTALFSALPEATDGNIAQLDQAVATMQSIPETERTTADNFKLTLFHSSAMGLRTKSFDEDGDGQVSPVELLDMDEEDAIAIIDSILSAEGALSASVQGGDGAAVSSDKISDIREQIDAQEGDTQSDKLRNYLAGGDSDAATTTTLTD